MDDLGTIANALGGLGALTVVAWLVITRKLIWHTDMDREVKRSERLERLLFDALGVVEKAADAADGTATALDKLTEAARTVRGERR